MASITNWFRGLLVTCCPHRARSAVPPSQLHAISVRVPADAQPGVSKLKVDVGGRPVAIPVPHEAESGDMLTLIQDGASSWRIDIKKANADIFRRRVLALVPGDAVPGTSEVYVDTLDGSATRVVVPSTARPGDLLTLTRGAKAEQWQCAHRRLDYDLSPPAPLADEHDLHHYEALRRATEASGASWSKKMHRGRTPSLGIPGMVANAQMAAAEEIGRVPAALLITANAARKAAPDLCRQVDALKLDMPRDQQEMPAKAAYLTQLIATAEGLVSLQVGSGDQQLVWEAHAKAMLSETFADHPYRLALQDPCGFRQRLQPSPEADLIELVAQGVLIRYEIIQQGVPPDVLGSGFTAERFLRAWLLIISRVFDLPHDTADGALVPHMDGFNHSVAGENIKVRWDAGANAMVAETTRIIIAGEELLLSYGPMSNPILFRTHGFTVVPAEESCCTYLSRPISAQQLLQAYLPPWIRGKIMQFDSTHLHPTIQAAIQACSGFGQNPVQFLKELVQFRLAAYRDNAQLRPLIGALEKNSLKTSGLAEEVKNMSTEIYPRLLNCDALRVKLSEFLCLALHLKALESESPIESEGGLGVKLRRELWLQLQAVGFAPPTRTV